MGDNADEGLAAREEYLLPGLVPRRAPLTNAATTSQQQPVDFLDDEQEDTISPSPIKRNTSTRVDTLRAQHSVLNSPSFTVGYSKLDRDALQGHLLNACTVTVHDYGEVDGKKQYLVNGSDSLGMSAPLKVNSGAELQVLADKYIASRPSWPGVRWVDVEGMNGDVVQYLLSLTACEGQFIFNNIVDLKQRAMGLVLDSEDDEAAQVLKFLLVSKVATLSPAAFSALDQDSAQLYSLPGFIEYEQITYLLRLDNASAGTLITFQEGKEGDVFGEVREALRSSSGRLHQREPSYLLLQLIRASNESVVHISNFIRLALDQLRDALLRAPDSLDLIAQARRIDGECERLLRTTQPFRETMEELTSDFPVELLGRSRAAWHSITVELTRLEENIAQEKARAVTLMEMYRDRLSRRKEQVQARMETSNNIMGLVLGLFSPLGVLAGIYGMNFVKSDGEHAILELLWGWEPSDPADPTSAPVWNGGITGYGYFWILVGAVAVLILLMYMALGLLPTPLDGYRYIQSVIRSNSQNKAVKGDNETVKSKEEMQFRNPLYKDDVSTK